MNEYNEIGARLRELREVSDYTIEDLAKELDLDPEVYASYEENGKDVPISVIYQIANKFKVDFTEEERKQVWYNSNNDERFYAVGEVELLDISGAKKVFAGKQYQLWKDKAFGRYGLLLCGAFPGKDLRGHPQKILRLQDQQ